MGVGVRAAGCGGRVGVRAHVVCRHAAGRPGADDVADVDADLARQLARRRRRQHAHVTRSDAVVASGTMLVRDGDGRRHGRGTQPPPVPRGRLLLLSSIAIRTLPTGQICPSAYMRFATRPARGDGISTVALSVMTSTIGWSSRTTSPP